MQRELFIFAGMLWLWFRILVVGHFIVIYFDNDFGSSVWDVHYGESLKVLAGSQIGTHLTFVPTNIRNVSIVMLWPWLNLFYSKYTKIILDSYFITWADHSNFISRKLNPYFRIFDISSPQLVLITIAYSAPCAW